MVSKPSCWGIFFVRAQTKIGPVSQQTLNILTKTKLTTKKTNISKLEDEIITSHLKSNL